MTISSSNKNPNETIGIRFVSAGIAACFADFVTFPLDTAKVRLQIQGENVQKINPINQQLKLSSSNNVRSSMLSSSSNVILKPIHLENAIPSRALYYGNIPIANTINSLPINLNAANEFPRYKGLIGTISTIVRHEGYKALYNGLVAGLQRQLSFASIRIGLYENVRLQYEHLLKSPKVSTNAPVKNSSSSGDIFIRILAGITTGGSAVLIAQPADVVKVRLQAQIPNGMMASSTNNVTSSTSTKNAASAATRYNGAMDAYRKIYAFEGLKGLWKGILPNMTRNAVINASELVGYDLFKQYLINRTRLTDTFPCHFFAAFGAGFVTTLIASPIDVVKTRFMNSPPKTYKGALHCAFIMFSREGPRAFYKGFTPSFMRLASWNIVMFVCYEQLKRQIIKFKTNT